MESVQVFAKDEIAEFYGVDKKALSVRSKLNFLIKTQSDLIRLEELLVRERNNFAPLWSALCYLHLEKVKENNMPYEVFENHYNTDKAGALETMFKEKIDQYKISKLENKIASNKITLQELYNKHQKELSSPILTFVK